MVVIDKLESLKAWLVKKLTPMCDADPSALAKYIIALVKKDKTDEELVKLCSDQLEVFLQQETSSFVSELFVTLKNKSYCEEFKQIETITGVSGNDTKEEELAEQKRSLKRRIGRTSPVRHDSRGPYDRRRRSKRSPRARRHRNYRSHSGSPKRTRISPKRRRSRSRSKSPFHRSRRARSLSSSRSPSRSPGSSHQKPSSNDDHATVTKTTRCWSYEQNGFCVLGENCPHDHGKDPVVLEGSTITSTGHPVTMPPKITPIAAPPPVLLKPVLPQMSIMPPPPFLPLPGLPVLPPHGMRLPPPPLLPPHGTIRVPPPVMPPQPPRSQPPPGYNPEAPGLSYSLEHTPNVSAVTSSPLLPLLSTGGCIPPPMVLSAPIQPAVYSTAPSGVQNTGFSKNNFNTNTKLVIRKIPPLLNNITKLNEHFSKFGAINNIQVKYEDDPQCALIEYAHVNSARAAKRDTGAVMNNRFIMVHWFNSNSSNRQGRKNQLPHLSGKDRLGTLPTMSQLKYTAPGKETKQTSQNDSGNTTTTIYRAGCNPSADTVQNVKDGKTLDSVDTKTKVKQAQLAAKEKFMAQQKIMIQKKIELQKQKRGLLDAQTAQQRLVLNKIKNSKTLPPGEKVKLLESLKVLTASIDKLRTSLKGEEAYNPMEGKEKHRKTQLQLLDAELDLHKASTAGESTLSLKRKLNQLKQEASSLGLVNAFTPSWDRSRGGYVPRAKAPRMFKASANLDRRPRELRVTGFHCDEKDELITHLARFGEIESFEFSGNDSACTVKFQTRAQAEVASVHGPNFKNRRLTVAWTTGTVSIATETPLPTPAVPESKAEEPAESPEKEESAVGPQDEGKDEDNAGDDVHIHVGEESFQLPEAHEEEEDEEQEEPYDDELDEEALLSADFDDDVDDQFEDNDEEIRPWRR